MDTTNTRRAARVVGWLSVFLALAACATTQPRASREKDPTLKGFMERVNDYVALRAKLAGEVPPLKQTDTPVQIVASEHALAEAIEQARAGAREGDVFGPAAPFFTSQLHHDWRRRTRSERAGLLRELPPGYRPKVNTVYPTTLPLVTFPPTLLERLPELPDGLEYRIVGPHLILRDVKSNVIVDVLPNALTGGDEDRRAS